MSNEIDNRDDDMQSRGGDMDRGKDGGDRGRRGKVFYKKKVCKFTVHKWPCDWKRVDILQKFITERGKILPRRITGTSAKFQRKLSRMIKIARTLALLPFVKN